MTLTQKKEEKLDKFQLAKWAALRWVINGSRYVQALALRKCPQSSAWNHITWIFSYGLCGLSKCCCWLFLEFVYECLHNNKKDWKKSQSLCTSSIYLVALFQSLSHAFLRGARIVVVTGKRHLTKSTNLQLRQANICDVGRKTQKNMETP